MYAMTCSNWTQSEKSMKIYLEDHILLAESPNYLLTLGMKYLSRFLQTDSWTSKLFKPSLPLPFFLNLSLNPFSNLTHLTNINTLLSLAQIVNLLLDYIFQHNTSQQSS